MFALRHPTDTAPTYTCAACLVRCAKWHATRRATPAIGALTAKNLSTLTVASGSGTPTTLVSHHLLSAGALDCLLHCTPLLVTLQHTCRPTSRNLARLGVARHQAAWHHTESFFIHTHCWLPTVCGRAIFDLSTLSSAQVYYLVKFIISSILSSLFLSPHCFFL